jgi:hypothetical protein
MSIYSEIQRLDQLNELIERRTESIDMDGINSHSEELDKRMTNAYESLINFLVAAKRVCNIDTGVYMRTLSLLMADNNGNRYIKTRVDKINVADLDGLREKRKAYALKYGIPEEVVLRFEKARTSPEYSKTSVQCRHPGCSVSKYLGFSNPVEMLEAEEKAESEIWYCHHHREDAFENEGALSDDLIQALQRINDAPGLTISATGAKRDEISFLEIINLIRIEKLNFNNRGAAYRVFITDDGLDVLRMLSKHSLTESAGEVA